jgi:ASPIC and UnbV/FG-GAP-like repeat
LIRLAAALAATVLLAAACSGSEPAEERSGQSTKAFDFVDVAREVGLDFRHAAFRSGVSADPPAMTGGGVCWLDYDDDGWLDLFVVNGFANTDRGGYDTLPTSRLFRNDSGRFEDVTADEGAGLPLRGQGCVAADLDGDGRTDLFVTGAERSVLLWNDGGDFHEGDLGVFGWHTGAAAGDLNGDGRPELFVAGYADLNNRIPEATLGFPNTYLGVRDLLFLNEGGRQFREVGGDAGLEVVRFAYGLGALMSDLDRDGDLDLYLANDTNPNRLYENVAWPGGRRADPAGLGFRLEERAAAAGVADSGAGMGVAAGDFDGDALPDLFVTNARRQTHGAFRSRPEGAFADVRAELGPSLTGSTGWGTSWADLDLDTDLDLVLVNGDIPITDLAADAEPVQAFLNDRGRFRPARLALPKLNARGSAAADYDNDGDLDLAVLPVGGRLALLENNGRGGNWLEVEGVPPGAIVTAVLPDGRRLVRDAQAGSSFLSSEDPRLHFGLGGARSVRELTVRWPGGAESTLEGVTADRIVAVAAPESPRAAAPPAAPCRRADLAGRSIARVWDELLLDAIRRDVPAPTVHARNLFHLSAAMWDAWAAYDPHAEGYFVREKHRAADVEAAREKAISYAAYRILLHRYSLAAGLEETFHELTSMMRSLCYPIGNTGTSGDSPAALGNRIAASVIAHGLDDGALEKLRYVDPTYRAANAPLVVEQPGTEMRDPSRWQPLALDRLVAQNGLPVPGKVQSYVGAQWGGVDPFALPEGLDPGPAPTAEDPAFLREARAVLRYSSELDPRDGVVVDVGPGARGGNTLGTNDGDGHARNPATGRPYRPDRMLRGDFGSALAEFWADGPESETPPGHWNTIANTVSDEVATGDRLEWDVKLYFALNGALHDAAVAAWGAKRRYETARPISMIRWLAAEGKLPRRVRSWLGTVRTEDWLPYQRPTFVTPAFPGYVSGHSTFSRAAAEVLTAATGTPFFPGGLFEWRVPHGSLTTSEGPSRDIVLQWATYYDAADDAGISRLYGGIHIPADDFGGRKLGSLCGKAAWARAQRYFEGTA